MSELFAVAVQLDSSGFKFDVTAFVTYVCERERERSVFYGNKLRRAKTPGVSTYTQTPIWMINAKDCSFEKDGESRIVGVTFIVTYVCDRNLRLGRHHTQPRHRVPSTGPHISQCRRCVSPLCYESQVPPFSSRRNDSKRLWQISRLIVAQA